MRGHRGAREPRRAQLEVRGHSYRSLLRGGQRRRPDLGAALRETGDRHVFGMEGGRLAVGAFLAPLALGRPFHPAKLAKHTVAVGFEAREGAELARHLGRGGVGRTGDEGGQGGGRVAGRIAVVGEAERHQQAR